MRLASVTQPLAIEESPTVEDLLSGDDGLFESLRSTLAHSPRQLDGLLLKLHFRRESKLTDPERMRVLDFLCSGYLLTGDVRYFNEMLWFKAWRHRDIHDIAFAEFGSLTRPRGFHIFPGASREHVWDYVHRFQRSVKETDIPPRRLAIGLVGIPGQFGKIPELLVEQGHDVSVYHVPYHADRLRHIVAKSPILVGAFNRYRGTRFPYKTVPHDKHNEELGEVLRNDHLDVGFHKLGFIVRPPAIEAFRFGLMNDHWGVLPYVRGRSSIQYSLLFGFPIVTTVHYIDATVDTGPIVAMYHYSVSSHSKVTTSSIKRLIRGSMTDRVIDAFALHADGKPPPIENPSPNGLQFFSMHPLLADYVDRRLPPVDSHLS